FFFQAEDGTRDFHVTGVQTCALPISYWIGVPLSVNASSSKFGSPTTAAISAIKIPSVNVVTTLVNATPRTNATARSRTVPRIKKVGRASCRDRGESREDAGALRVK